ncbi:MAG TPA: lysylphosphatidylglycerol synthase transmembrane domain-containing protein [Candidatus Nanoarchaeia archaeon]|nr:lysylphosphatidylglycerol synthase transmembrane domain-containing protein [Candidatus Nanoarchaeia archaeon]
MALKTLQSKRIILISTLGLTIFILYLYFYVGTGNFVDIVKQVNIYFYLSAFAAFFAATFFSALTWHSLLDNLNVQSSIRRIVILTWAGYFLDTTLPDPGWSGDITKSYMLSKKADQNAGKIVASVVSQKIISMAVTIFLLALGFGLLAFSYVVPLEVITFFATIVALSIASFLIVYFLSASAKSTKTLLNKLMIPVLSFFLRSRFNEVHFREEAEKFLNTFHEGVSTLKAEKRALAVSVAYYLLSVAFDISIVFLVFLALGFSIPLDKVLIVYALTGTLSSVGVAFVGLTEIVMTSLYQVLLIPLAISFSVSLLTRIITLWFKLIAGYIAFHLAGVEILVRKKQRDDDKEEPGMAV